MSESLIEISKVRVHKRCPRCSSVNVRRGASLDPDTSLWGLSERCIMCGYHRESVNVKAGI